MSDELLRRIADNLDRYEAERHEGDRLRRARDEACLRHGARLAQYFLLSLAGLAVAFISYAVAGGTA